MPMTLGTASPVPAPHPSQTVRTGPVSAIGVDEGSGFASQTSAAGLLPNLTCAPGCAACVRAASRAPGAAGCSVHGSRCGCGSGADSGSAASHPSAPQTASASESRDPFGGPRVCGRKQLGDGAPGAFLRRGALGAAQSAPDPRERLNPSALNVRNATTRVALDFSSLARMKDSDRVAVRPSGANFHSGGERDWPEGVLAP